MCRGGVPMNKKLLCRTLHVLGLLALLGSAVFIAALALPFIGFLVASL